MNILLINSKSIYEEGVSSRRIYFPIGLLSIGATLKKIGYRVRFLDLNLHPSEDMDRLIEREINESIPDIVGIGGLFSGAWQMQKEASRKIKSLVPNAFVVLGGIHATMFSLTILKRHPFIDCIVLGEGEETLCQIIIRVVNQQNLFDIDGIAFRSGDQVVISPKTTFANVDLLPNPDYSLLNVEDYSFDTENWWSPKGLPVGIPFPILTSRSCPKRCSFCSMNLVHGRGIRERNPIKVVDEIESLQDKYGATYFEIMDDNLTYNKNHVLSFCREIIRRGIEIQFCTPNGVAVEGFDSEVCSALVEAGLVRVCLAIESGSEFIRNKSIGKQLSTEQIWSAVRACSPHLSLHVSGFFVFGMPEETPETLEESVEMAIALPLDKAYVFFATPYPGTSLFRKCVREGLIDDDDMLENQTLRPDVESPHFKPKLVSIEELKLARQCVLDHYNQRTLLDKCPERA